MARNILIIKHGALGDFILATGPMKAIRQHHPEAKLILLTTKPYVGFAEASGWFAEVWVDERPKLWQVGALFRLLKQLTGGNFERVYDLQTSKRSSWYFSLWRNYVRIKRLAASLSSLLPLRGGVESSRLQSNRRSFGGGEKAVAHPLGSAGLASRVSADPAPPLRGSDENVSKLPEWSGIAPGCSHRHDTPQRVNLHTVDRQKEQLSIAGIDEVALPDINWLQGDISGFSLTSPYALLVPGGSAHRPEKRWPVEHYAALAEWLLAQGIQPVLIGAGAEEALLNEMMEKLPFLKREKVINLCNHTSFGQIASLAREAALAVGNDTGPMHIIAATGCSSVVLFSSASNPDLCAPRGEHVRIIRETDLKDLEVEEVIQAINNVIPEAGFPGISDSGEK